MQSHGLKILACLQCKCNPSLGDKTALFHHNLLQIRTVLSQRDYSLIRHPMIPLQIDPPQTLKLGSQNGNSIISDHPSVMIRSSSPRIASELIFNVFTPLKSETGNRSSPSAGRHSWLDRSKVSSRKSKSAIWSRIGTGSPEKSERERCLRLGNRQRREGRK
ncbi:hypothetical protein V2J09_017524 [Rumex salicifolius]